MLQRASDDEERDLLNILWETGCRPQEARVVEACHFGRVQRTLAHPSHPCERKTGNPCCLPERCCSQKSRGRLAKQLPVGPIFRNSKGRPWTRNAIKCRFRKYGELDIDGLCATAFRHSWTTHALTRGVDALSVSILLGHKDTSMISRYYSHLTKHPDFLREQARRARSEPGSQSP